MQFTIKPLVADKLRSQCLVLPVQAGKLTPTGSAIDGRLDKALTAALKSGDLAKKAGSTLLLRSAGAVSRILLVSVGDADEVTEKNYQDAVRAALRVVMGTGAAEATVCLQEVGVAQRELRWRLAQAVLVTRELAYRFDQFKSNNDATPTQLAEVVFAVDRESIAAARIEVDRMQALADGIDLTKDLGNLPANVCNPAYLADQARRLARRFKLKCEVLEQKQMAALKMGSFLAVGQGSANAPKLVVLHYNGGPAKQAPVVLVGKGITFDTGGISLKPAAEMDEMKYDMSGAGTVLGVMQAVAQMKLKVNLICVVAAAENMPSGSATRPGDIVTTMSGQTVEILNTDAEGRLVLCDALTYVERFKPAAVVDIATLTGACVIALGHHHAGLFSPSDALADRLGAAGKDMSDTCWRMPLDEAYQESLRSPFADMGNIGGRAGGAVTAACFLSRFTKAYKWAHLDIAGVAWKSGANKGASGRPVGLLARYLIDQAD
ncbi:MAG: leucyl aminopeptidase [Lautropia sp.]|nr:leucyl aminopeptidase [Lautropia sp.]